MVRTLLRARKQIADVDMEKKSPLLHDAGRAVLLTAEGMHTKELVLMRSAERLLAQAVTHFVGESAIVLADAELGLMFKLLQSVQAELRRRLDSLEAPS